MKRSFVMFAGAAAASLAAFGPAYGQTREEIQRDPVSPSAPNGAPRIAVEGDIERAPCPLAGEEFRDITVTLSSVDFGDLKGISTDILRPAYARYLGKTLSIATVCEIRDEAATLLRRQGYLAAVQVPPQRIENGIVRFDVLLAKLVDFQVRGNAGKAEGLISGYLAAIKEQPVFNIVEAERYLLLARDIPGYDVRLTLRPAGTVPGEVIGEVQVVHTPFEMEANAQNYGSKDVGRFGGIVQAHINGLFGVGDRTTFGFFSTADFQEQQVVRLGEEVRIGRDGLTLVGNLTYAWTHPSLGPSINLRSRTLVGEIEARYPLVRRQTKNLFLSGGLDLINQRANLIGVPISQDRLRVGFARLEYDSIDPESLVSTVGYSASEPKWRLGGAVELRHGVSVFGASDGCGPNLSRCAGGIIPPSRAEGDPTALVLRAQGLAEFRPTPVLTFSVAPRAQYASKVLLSYEQFSAGNFTVGRGYDPGTLVGDSGIGMSTEMRYGSLVPKSASAIAWQGYAFFDGAKVWNEASSFQAPGLKAQSLYSAGAGLRLAFGDRMNFDIGAAVPLKRAGLDPANPALAKPRGDVRILMNLSVRLVPWTRR